MNIQIGIPRPIFNIQEHPEYIHIHTLAKLGVSDGGVVFNATTDPGHGVRATRQLDPMATYRIEGEDGFEGYEYVLPFWELFKHTLTIKSSTLAHYGASGYGHRDLVPFTTGGFMVTARSAFRASPSEYMQQIVGFQILMPVTGGGIIRLADCPFDISNSTFNPYAPHPRAIVNLSTQDALNSAHRQLTPAMQDKRAARIKAAEASMANAAEDPRLPGRPPPALPPKR